jgi:hypothetical protein
MHRRRLIPTSLVALTIAAAVAAPAASAMPIDPVVTTDTPYQDLRNPDRQAPEPGGPSQDLRNPDTIDAAAGRGTFNAPEVLVVKVPEPAAPVADGGIDWMDAGIGAGTLFGLVLVAAGGSLLVVHRRHAGAVGV